MLLFFTSIFFLVVESFFFSSVLFTFHLLVVDKRQSKGAKCKINGEHQNVEIKVMNFESLFSPYRAQTHKYLSKISFSLLLLPLLCVCRSLISLCECELVFDVVRTECERDTSTHGHI